MPVMTMVILVAMMMSMMALVRLRMMMCRWRCRIVWWRIFWRCIRLLLLLLLLRGKERLESGGHGLHPVAGLLVGGEEEPGDLVTGPGPHRYHLALTGPRGQVRSVWDVGRVLTGSYQVRREDQLGSSQHGAPVSSIVPGQDRVGVEDELHLLPRVAVPLLYNRQNSSLLTVLTNLLVNFLAGPALTVWVDSSTGQSSSPEQSPILRSLGYCCHDHRQTEDFPLATHHLPH